VAAVAAPSLRAALQHAAARNNIREKAVRNLVKSENWLLATAIWHEEEKPSMQKA